MTVNTFEEAIQAVSNPEDFVRTIGPGADTSHLHLFSEVPNEFTNWREEQSAWKESCAIADLSHHMYDLHVEGPDALAVFEDLGINSFDGFEPGKAKQFAACNESGYLIGDGILFYLDVNSLNLVGYSAINWVRYHLETNSYDATYTLNEHSGARDGPPADFRYQVQGPDALQVIKEATDGKVPEVPFFNFRELSISGQTVYALRHGMMDEPGFEIFGDWEYANDVQERIVDVGRSYGIRQIGSMAYPTNIIPNAWIPIPVPAIFGEDTQDYRNWLEAGSFEGAFTVGGSFAPESIEQYYLDPFDAGHGRFIDFDHDFIGREALKERAEQPQREKVTLVWNGDETTDLFGSLFTKADTPRYVELPTPNWAISMYDEVSIGDEFVGLSVSPRYLYFERSLFSIGVIDSEYATPGTELTLTWGEPGESQNPRVESHDQREITVTVAPAPYYEDKRKSTDYSAI